MYHVVTCLLQQPVKTISRESCSVFKKNRCNGFALCIIFLPCGTFLADEFKEPSPLPRSMSAHQSPGPKGWVENRARGSWALVSSHRLRDR